MYQYVQTTETVYSRQFNHWQAIYGLSC